MTSRPARHDFLDEWSLFLRRVSLFHDLEAEDLKEIAGKLQPLSLPKGATLYRENDPADALYVVQSGRVKAVTVDEEGKEKVLNFLEGYPWTYEKSYKKYGNFLDLPFDKIAEIDELKF